MITAWTWNQWAHEWGTFSTAMIAIACCIYLARKLPTALQNRERKLRVQAIAMGLSETVRENHRRFSLLDLLVVVTLVAALAGLFVGLAHQQKDGIPRMGAWPEFKQAGHQKK
jgi:hypothetical protein